MKKILPILLLALPLLGQSDNAAKRFMRDYASDQKRIWLSPLHMNQKQFWTVAVPLVGGTVGLKTLDRRITDGLPNTQDQIDWSKRVSLIGSTYTLAGAVGGATVAGYASGNPRVTEMGRNGGLALASSLTVTYALKLVTWRERPDKPGSKGSFWSGGDSFPSGHAMTAFAVATAIARHPRCPKWLGYTLYGAATAVTLSRVSSNRHWASDAYFGAFSGILIGNSVANAARKR